jgi:hypothetical protein
LVEESEIITAISGLGYEVASDTLVPLNKLATIHAGTAGFQAGEIAKCIVDGLPSNSDAIPFIVTGNIDRYEIIKGNVRYMGKQYYNPYFLHDTDIVTERKWELFKNPKVIIAGMVTQLEATYDDMGYALGVNVFNLTDCAVCTVQT